jgi:DNA invertase Pin-like site-specific DNA recombinase
MSSSTPKTVALYARVSTMDQSCDLQLEDLRRYASQRFGRCFEVVDEGVSGTQRRRPQLDELMSQAHKRRFDVVLVWKFDPGRAARTSARCNRVRSSNPPLSEGHHRCF